MNLLKRAFLFGLAASCSAGLCPNPFDPVGISARAEDAASIIWPSPSRRVEISRPFGGSEIVIGASSRTAGAIDSLVWNGRQFVNAYDHGRELQSAASFDGYGECFNPTEAGSVDDFVGETSSSLLLNLRAGPNWIETKTEMAFWFGPQRAARDCPTKPARYDATRAGYTLDKRVAIGAAGIANAISHRVTFGVPQPFGVGTFEVVTGYMPPDFSRFWTFDPATNQLSPLTDGPGEQELPVILSTPDGAHAMGVYSPGLPQTDFPGAGYGRFRFAHLRKPGNATVKWNCVFRRKNGQAGDHTFTCFTVVGSLEDAQRGLRALHRLRP